LYFKNVNSSLPQTIFFNKTSIYFMAKLFKESIEAWGGGTICSTAMSTADAVLSGARPTTLPIGFDCWAGHDSTLQFNFSR
jgi:hypothetical protein